MTKLVEAFIRRNNCHEILYSLPTAASECIDERLKLFNDSCYLVVSFPEVEWIVAQKICNSMGAQLSSVSNPEEHR